MSRNKFGYFFKEGDRQHLYAWIHVLCLRVHDRCLSRDYGQLFAAGAERPSIIKDLENTTRSSPMWTKT